MVKKIWMICLFLVCMSLPLVCGWSQSPHEKGRLQQESSQDWAQIELGNGCVLINNVWNKGAASEAYHQRIFQETLKGKPSFGWQWQWPPSGNVLAYPEVVFGDKPWDPPVKRVSQLPFRVGEMKITADFKINIQATGAYNMAFEFWTVSALPATKDTISHEIMIWIANHGLTPAGVLQDTLKVGGTSFDVYVNKIHGDTSGQASNNWTYIAFAAQKPLLKGSLDFSQFLDYLLGKGILTKDIYITSLELGNEIAGGAGIVEISDYAVTILPK